MRDRLIELLCSAPLGSKTFEEQYYKSTITRIADYLLENGVIVPPCKVGDNIYFNKAEIDETCPAKVIKICNNFYTPSMPLWITIEYESKLIGRQEVEMGSDVFELLCLPTKEEAEKALRKEDEHK